MVWQDRPLFEDGEHPLSVTEFDARFKQLTGHEPLRWQKRLFQRLLSADLPVAIDLPTGLGKTSVIAIWYLALTERARLPRRLAYVVDRRAVVDQATAVAEQIKIRSGDATLRVSTLRGQFVDNRAWLEDPAAPAIIVGTVDMIGSRLLFEGYGVSRRMRPYHAGLLGADALVVLDESHLVPPFERLLHQMTVADDLGPRDEADRQCIPAFHVLPLSATGRDRDDDVFRLEAEDENDSIVKQRLSATKRLTFRCAGDGKLEEQLANEAWALTANGTTSARLLVYCNSRDVAEKTKKKIEDTAEKARLDIATELFVGARRVKERVDAASRLKELGFIAGTESRPEEPTFVIATSAGEVGVDLDADHLVCDLVPWERMVQRFGRVNRLGGVGREARIIVVDKVHEKSPETLKACAARCRKLLENLPQDADVYDVRPGALRDLKLRAADDPALQKTIDAATTPEPLYPALTRALVDAWAMTSLAEHTGRPEVQPWLRGWIEDDPPQTTVVWRKYLPVRDDGAPATAAEMRAFFAAAPPHLAETLETETFRVVDWLKSRVTRIGAPVTVAGGEADDLPPLSRDSVVCVALDSRADAKAYRLKDLHAADKVEEALKQALAGATVVVDARFGGLSGGLLDTKADDKPASAADDGWHDGGADPLVPFRVRRVRLEEQGAAAAADISWQPIYAFDVARDAEGKQLVQLVVEKWRSEAPDEDARSISSRPQSLSKHHDWTRKKAEALATALGLDADLARAIVLAARLHDEGKQAARWQNAFRTPEGERPYAKSDSRRPPDFDLLAGYRHEFGSLFHLETDNEFGTLPEDLKDLVRHLVVAHHGRGRPVIETDGCEEGPPSLLAARACDVALRFARLQKRFGPWGLAWLEALVRAADQQASRALEEGKPDG
jgi:CRISPR-associated endonuclease/helicase Cas3